MAFDLKFVIYFYKERESVAKLQRFPEINSILKLVKMLQAVCHLYASASASHRNIISFLRSTRFVNSAAGSFLFFF
jgi:hypothetical protein